MERTLHPTPRGRDIVREQLRIVALALRPAALVFGLVIAVVTVLIVVDMVRGSAETWFDSDDWSPIMVASFLLPFAIWRTDKRFRPAFLWTLPVDRPRLALAKVFAGWVWLITAVATLIVWQQVLAMLSRVASPETIPLIALPGATTAYLLGSAVVLGVRHPLRWLCGGAGVVWLVAMLHEVTDRRDDPDASGAPAAIQFALDQAESIWRGLPQSSQWAIATIVPLLAGLAALFAALARHRERRRH